MDAALPRSGLDRGAVHEWLGVDESPGDPIREQAGNRARHAAGDRVGARRAAEWSPAIALVLQILRSILNGAHPKNLDRTSDRLVWIGQAVWPYAPAMRPASADSAASVIANSLFVRACIAGDRLWAADLALRSRAAAAVIADGSGFDMAATRRLQLAAEAGGALCLLARPPWERAELSAAATRWLVACCPSPNMTRRWTVELLRCKGMQPTTHAPHAPHAARAWTLERDDATGALRVAADVLDRSGRAAAEEKRRIG